MVPEWSSRYLHLNPVRGQALGLGKTERARRWQRVGRTSPTEEIRLQLELLKSYPWSSYRAHMGLEQKPEWLTCKRVWESFGQGRFAAPSAVAQPGRRFRRKCHATL